MSSISSKFISNITAFRNPNGPEQEWTNKLFKNRANPLKITVAEIGYILTFPFAIIESAILGVAKVFFLCLSIDSIKNKELNDRLTSSFFSIAWSFTNLLINIFCNDMIETEKVAKACAASGNIFSVPCLGMFY